MRFEEAYRFALMDSKMRKAIKRVEEGQKNGEETGCYLFSCGSEVFYYGFDGCELQKGKHTAKRSIELIRNGEAYRVM